MNPVNLQKKIKLSAPPLPLKKVVTRLHEKSGESTYTLPPTIVVGDIRNGYINGDMETAFDGGIAFAYDVLQLRLKYPTQEVQVFKVYVLPGHPSSLYYYATVLPVADLVKELAKLV